MHRVRYSVLNTQVFKKQKNSLIKRGKKVDVLSVMSWYNQHKGPDVLDEVVKKLKSKHNNYRFTLISREKKPYSTIFDEFYSNPKPKTIAKLYYRSDILLATSRSEGFFIPGLEAMACGCLFVTTNSRGVLDYAKNNVNAIIITNPDDIWKDDLIEKLLNNPSKANSLKREGHITAEKYSIENIIEEFEDIFSMYKQSSV